MKEECDGEDAAGRMSTLWYIDQILTTFTSFSVSEPA